MYNANINQILVSQNYQKQGRQYVKIPGLFAEQIVLCHGITLTPL